MTLPEKFEFNMTQLLGEDLNKFKESLKAKPPVSIRINPSKKIENKYFEIESNVKWSSEGKYLKKRPIFTLDPAYHAGAYYVQEASSMFLEHVFNSITDRSKPLRVLDLCAAPGGKTTLLASLLGDNDILVANEVIKTRLTILKENLLKWGYKNLIIVNQDPETFSDLEGFFDIVLVDAPCSGEGLFRKDPLAVQEWSINHVTMCSARQRRILTAAALLVGPGGSLIYSTCTYNSLENQENVKWINRTLDFETTSVEVPEEWNITKSENCFQFFPHKNQGEGFFIAALKNLSREAKFVKGKVDFRHLQRAQIDALRPWIKEEVIENFEYFRKNDGIIIALNKKVLNFYGSVFKALSKRSSGLEIGIFKGNDFVPSHAFALTDLASNNVQRLELDEKQALLFLKKETFDFEVALEGWALVTYQGLGLGWIKKIGNRINNYLPTEWRIRMDIE